MKHTTSLKVSVATSTTLLFPTKDTKRTPTRNNPFLSLCAPPLLPSSSSFFPLKNHGCSHHPVCGYCLQYDGRCCRVGGHHPFGKRCCRGPQVIICLLSRSVNGNCGSLSSCDYAFSLSVYAIPSCVCLSGLRHALPFGYVESFHVDSIVMDVLKTSRFAIMSFLTQLSLGCWECKDCSTDYIQRRRGRTGRRRTAPQMNQHGAPFAPPAAVQPATFSSGCLQKSFFIPSTDTQGKDSGSPLHISGLIVSTRL